MRRAYGAFLIVAATAATAALAAPPALSVEARVVSVEVDDAKPPVIVEVEVALVNRAEQLIDGCDVELRYLDAKGKAVMTRKHPVAALELKPGAETLTSFQDLDPPKSWARVVEVSVRCRAK